MSKPSTSPGEAKGKESTRDSIPGEAKGKSSTSPPLQSKAKGGLGGAEQAAPPAPLDPSAQLALVERALKQRAVRGLVGAVVTAGLAVGVVAGVFRISDYRTEGLTSTNGFGFVLALFLLRVSLWFGGRVRPGDLRAPGRSPLRVSLDGDGGAVEAIGERVGPVSEVWVRMQGGDEIGLPVAADEVAPLVSFLRQRCPQAETLVPPGGRRPGPATRR